jgi:prepilin signal peptidase PulO-like enzyme (type II secretory pathway)
MILDIILVFIALIFLIIASYHDIKTREIPDYISYSLITIAILFSLIKSIYFTTFSFIVQSLFGLLVFLLLSFFLYYTKQWGGGDAKLLIALGASFPVYPEFLISIFNPNLSLPYLLIFLINLVIVGSIYAIIYSIVLTLKEKDYLTKNFNKKYLISLFAFVILLLISLFFPQPFNLLVVVVALLSFYPFLFYYVKLFEKHFMIKSLPLSKITEGDWLAKDVFKNKKLILSKNSPGLTLEDLKKLKQNKINQVTIKYGMPFIPSFLLAFIISMFFGNLF